MKKILIALLPMILVSLAFANNLKSDLNQDGVVDFKDFATMAGEWLQLEDGDEPNVLYDNSLCVTDGTAIPFGASVWMCQSFVADGNYLASGIKIRTWRTGNPNDGNVIVSIYEASSQTLFPIGQPLASLTINIYDGFLGSMPQSNLSNVNLVKFVPHIPLINGMAYSIVLQADEADSMKVYRNDYSYCGYYGVLGTSTDNGATWTGSIGWSSQFAIFSPE